MPPTAVVPDIIDKYLTAKLLWEALGLSYADLEDMPASVVRQLSTVHRAAMNAEKQARQS